MAEMRYMKLKISITDLINYLFPNKNTTNYYNFIDYVCELNFNKFFND